MKKKFDHEAAVFIRRSYDLKSYELLHFNPSIKHFVHIFREFVKNKDKNVPFRQNIFAYQHSTKNRYNMCSYYAWEELIFCLGTEMNPFMFPNSWHYNKHCQQFVEINLSLMINGKRFKRGKTRYTFR